MPCFHPLCSDRHHFGSRATSHFHATPRLMAVLTLTDAIATLPQRGALVGLDLGTKTIGVAVSDPDRRLAAGVTTIARKTFSADAERLLALATERQAVGFVL